MQGKRKKKMKDWNCSLTHSNSYSYFGYFDLQEIQEGCSVDWLKCIYEEFL